jgi:hypothetical protein
MELQSAMLIISAIVFAEVVRLVARSIYHRIVSPGHITQEDCKKCSEEKSTALAELKAEVLVIKRILLVMARTQAVPDEEIKRLVE